MCFSLFSVSDLVRFCCCRRAKLYVYGESLLDKGTGNKQWNERGKGDVKILK